MRPALKMAIVVCVNHRSSRMSERQREGWRYVRPSKSKRRELTFVQPKPTYVTNPYYRE